MNSRYHISLDQCSQARINTEEDIISLIIEAGNATNKKNSFSSLHKAKDLCKKLIKDGNPKGHYLMAGIFSELAKESDLPSKRYEFWKDSISEGLRGLEKYNEPSYADLIAEKTVDFVQDNHIAIPKTEAIQLFASVKKKIDFYLDKLPLSESYYLLSRKSALLRNIAKFSETRKRQQILSEQAIRCAQKAVDINPNSWYTYLELALSLWHISQFDRDDVSYNNRLKSAEHYFWESITIEPNVYNLLSLSRFFRSTYQTSPFLESFDMYERIEYNRRRFLQGSHVYSEVAMQLWYSEYPTKVVNIRLEDAERLLEDSINAGYGDARHVVDLAFIKAARNEIDVGIEILNALHNLPKDTAWTEISKIVSDIGSEDDLITRGFALGVSYSSTWNQLGTFALSFLKDLELSVTLYKEALRINRSNAVAMTNLARALSYKNTPESIREANMWISKAGSCANRRFRWWRNVREEIKLKMMSITEQQTTVEKTSKQLKLKRLSDLYQNYQRLKTLENPQSRGYKLEKLVNRLFKMSLGNSYSSYRTSSKVFKSPDIQIDAAFSFFDRDFYRVETKWTSKPVTPNDIILFREKIDVIDVKGLFISISGFTPEAIHKAYELRKERQILLMDGDELDYILQGSPSFDEAIRLKQIYFAKDSNPFHKIKQTVQLEAASD
jgi:tetratricopeptide (TPR) repeat protein